MDTNVQPGVGKFGCIWLEWFACGQGIWLKIFEKSQIPPPPLLEFIHSSGWGGGERLFEFDWEEERVGAY